MFLALMALLVAGSGASSNPRFEDHPVGDDELVAAAELRGPDLASHPLAKRYRTILRRETRGEPNFSGHFNLVRIGCGSACAFLAVVDRATGRVFFPDDLGPLSWSGWQSDDYGYEFRRDSHLIRACGDLHELGRPACHYYVWAGDHPARVGTNPGLVDSSVATRGLAILEAVKRGEGVSLASLYRDEESFDYVMDRIAEGGDSWLDVAAHLAPSADAHAGEELTSALAEALGNAPEAVLSRSFAPLTLDGVCTGPGAVEDEEPYRAVLERSLAAVARITNPNLTVSRDACMKLLKEDWARLNANASGP